MNQRPTGQTHLQFFCLRPSFLVALVLSPQFSVGGRSSPRAHEETRPPVPTPPPRLRRGSLPRAAHSHPCSCLLRLRHGFLLEWLISGTRPRAAHPRDPTVSTPPPSPVRLSPRAGHPQPLPPGARRGLDAQVRTKRVSATGLLSRLDRASAAPARRTEELRVGPMC